MPNEVSLGNQVKESLRRFTKFSVRIPYLVHAGLKAISGRSCTRKKALSIDIIARISTGFPQLHFYTAKYKESMKMPTIDDKIRSANGGGEIMRAGRWNSSQAACVRVQIWTRSLWNCR